MKKTLSILLSFIMIISITSGLNLTAYAETHSGKCGENVNCSLDTATGELNITGTGAMYYYNEDASDLPWYSYRSSITKVNISNGVTSIGDWAFSECTSLASVTIPNSVTSIGVRAFSDCTSLTSVTIPNSVTSIGHLAFSECTSLTSITIPNSVTSIGECAFNNTEYYNDENNWVNDVLYIDNCLIDAKNTISGSYNINDNTRIIAYEAFLGCTSLASVTIPNSVESISYKAFYSCYSLKSVTIPNSVVSIGWYAFYNCKSLTSITIPNSVTSIGYCTFYGCETLTDVYYGSTQSDWNNISINYSNECLTNANIHYTNGVINEKEEPTTTAPTQPIIPVTAQPVITIPTEQAPMGAKKVNGEWVAKKQKNAKIKKLTKANKSFKATWKKVSGVKGYQIQYSTSKKFTKKTTKSVTIKKNKTTSKTVKKLKAKKKYYVRIRTYKNVKLNGKTIKVYSSWTKAKTVKTK